jgi:hypothetical protein
MHQMKLKVLVAAIAVAGLAATAVVAVAASGNARSADVRADVSAIKQEQKAAKAAATLVSASDVGDADSFGRNARWIGLMSSGVIQLTDFADDCLPENFQGGPDDHCVVLNPQPMSTSFSFPDVGRMVIPGKSANSLFCHAQTPISTTLLQNTSGAGMTARITYTPTYTFENPVLADPSLIDPTTGLPFNGKLTQTLSGIRHQLTLQPGENFWGRDDETRVCINGMISKKMLMTSFGLTDAQATKFFTKDTIVTMGINGNAQGVIFSSMINNVRWLGD